MTGKFKIRARSSRIIIASLDYLQFPQAAIERNSGDARRKKFTTVKKILLAVSLACSLPTALIANEPATARAPESAKPIPHDQWSYILDEQGNPVFEQHIEWDGDPNALKYELTIRGKDGSETGTYETETPEQRVSLRPGDYEYRIDTYSVLGRIEDSTDWIPMTVIEAIYPEIDGITPRNVYIENLNGIFTITGKHFQDGCVVKLRSASGLSAYSGKILGKTGNEEITTEFPGNAYNPGIYTIEVLNPSGLSRSVKNAVQIRYQKPVDIAIGGGYAPYFLLHDSWSAGIWNRVFYPLGAGASADIFFIKRQWGYVGIELAGSYRYLAGGPADSVITSHEFTASANAIAALRISRTILALARAGGGACSSYHAFSYGDLAGPKTESFDPHARAGISARFLLPFRTYAEVGAEYSCVFYMNHVTGGIAPSVSFGYQY
jgi:hypothetical protein